MFKKIISSIMTLAIMASIGTTVMAREVMPARYNDNAIHILDATDEELLKGELVSGDTIYGRPIYGDANSNTRQTSPNYAWSQENWFVFYKGYIQFQPSYPTSGADGNGLLPGRHVKQAWVDFM